MQIFIFVGECGVRFEILNSTLEAEEMCHNSENWQEVKPGEIPVIVEQLEEIQKQIDISKGEE